MCDLLPNLFKAMIREELDLLCMLLSWYDGLWAVPGSFSPLLALLYAAAWSLENGSALGG